MRCFPALLLALCASFPAYAAPPRIALVKVKDIYTEHASTIQLQEKTKLDREEIMKNSRAADLRRSLEELDQIQTKIADKDNPPDEATGSRLAQEYELKRQEAQTLQREFEAFRTQREKEINREMVAGMRQILNRINEVATKLAKERSYDLMFDSSGNTNTGVAFIVHHQNSSDITEDVRAALKDADAAAAPPPADSPKPASPPKPPNAKR